MLPSLCHLYLKVLKKQTGEPRVATYSGFLWVHRNCPFWVTAGHVIDELKNLLGDDELSILEVRMLAGPPMAGNGSVGLPIALDRGSMGCIDHDVAVPGGGAGLDFGLIRMRPFFVDGLSRIPGVRWLDANDSKGFDPSHTDGLLVIGAPCEGVRADLANDVTLVVHCLPARLLPRAPEDLRPELPCAIYGQLLDETALSAPVREIRGMSGGPVVAVEQRTGGGFGFRVVGIQSAWVSSSRHVRISSIPHMLRAIEGALDREPSPS